MEISRLGQGANLSQLVSYGGIAYLSGMTAQNKKADIQGQGKQILEAMEELLNQAGSSKSRLLMVNIYLADIRTKDQFNAVWQAWVDPSAKPARAAVQTQLGAPDVLIEISAVAALS